VEDFRFEKSGLDFLLSSVVGDVAGPKYIRGKRLRFRSMSRLPKVPRLLDICDITTSEYDVGRGDRALTKTRVDQCTLSAPAIDGGRWSVSSHQENRMKNFVLRFVNETEGQDLIEYALLAALIALACILGMQALATGINNKFSSVSATLAS
jgi:pilus assembly protein Flp/PilA